MKSIRITLYIISGLALLSILLINFNCSPEKEPPPVQVEKEEPVKIISKAPTEASVGREYVYQVEIKGTPVFKWKLVDGPNGMGVDQGGKLTLPAASTKEGSHKVKIKVSNIAGSKLYEDTQTFTLQIKKKKGKEGKKQKKKIAIPVSVTIRDKPKKPDASDKGKTQKVPIDTKEFAKGKTEDKKEPVKTDADKKDAIKEQKLAKAVKDKSEDKKEPVKTDADKKDAIKEQKLAKAVKDKSEDKKEPVKTDADKKDAIKEQKLAKAVKDKSEDKKESVKTDADKKDAIKEQKLAKAVKDKSEYKKEPVKTDADKKDAIKEQKLAKAVKDKSEDKKEPVKTDADKKDAIREQKLAKAVKDKSEDKKEPVRNDNVKKDTANESKQKKILKQKTEKQKKEMKDFVFKIKLEGWSFEEFCEWTRKKNLKILLTDNIAEENLEVILDSPDNLDAKKSKWDRNYSVKVARVKNLPPGQNGWIDYELDLCDKLGVNGHELLLVFPVQFLYDLLLDAKAYYHDNIATPDIEFEKGAGNVMFNISKDNYMINILEMGNTR